MVSIPSDVSSWMKNSWLKYLFPNFIHIFMFTSTSTQHLHVVLWLATNISPPGNKHSTFLNARIRQLHAEIR